MGIDLTYHHNSLPTIHHLKRKGVITMSLKSLKEKILEVFKKIPAPLSKQAITIITYTIAGVITIFLLSTAVHYIRYGGRIPVEISSVSPTGEVPLKTNFTLEFTADIVDESKINTILFPKDVPVIFEPKIPGRFKWLSTRMLRFFPEISLPPATPYTIEVLPKICTKENSFFKGTRKFDFYTERLKITHALPRFIFERKAKIEVRIEWSLEFNQSVDPIKLKDHLKLYYDLKVGQRSIPFTIHPEDKPNKVFKIITEVIKRGQDEELIKLRVDKELTGVEGKLGLACDFIGEMKVEPNLKVYQVYSQQSGRDCWIRIEFSAAIDSKIAKDYIKLDPMIDFRVEQDDRYLNLKGNFKPGDRYQVNIAEGLPREDGTFLQKDFSTTVRLEDLEPSLSFQHKGIFLCRQGKMNVGIESVNLKKFNIEVNKIFANNLVYYLSQYDPYAYWESPGVGKKIYEKEMTIEAEKNQIVTTVLNIGQFINDKRKGLFKVSIYDEEEYWRHDCLLVMATDLGIVAKLAQDDLVVWVNSLKTLAPLSDVEINLISNNNQLLAGGKTDNNGILVIKDLKNKIEDFTPYIITASLGGDLSYLKFDDCRMPASSFDIGGRPHLTSGYEAYLYTDRGVFRPGDKAHIVCLVRGKDISLPPEFPVKLQIIDPTNVIFKEFSKTITGIGEFELNLPDYAKIGRYLAELLVGDEEIGRVDFHVEDFMPDKIKVKIATDKNFYSTGNDVLIDVTGLCLFGPPAAGRNVTAQCQIKAHPFTPKKWSDYTFGDADKGFEEVNLDVGEAELDEKGTHRFSINIPKEIYPPASLKGVISATVKEHGGRAVSAYTSVDIHPYPFYIGLRASVEGYAEIGKKYEVDYIAVNPQGEKIRPNTLSASFYRIIWHSVLKKDSSGYYRYVSERNDQLVKSFSFNPQDMKRISFVPKEYGEYKIVISDPQNKSAASLRFYASGWGYAPWSMANPDRIEIDLDRQTYSAGEIARVQIKAPFPGKMLLCIEREKVVNYRIFNLKENTAVIEVPVEEGYKPNVYLTATIIRSIESKDSHTPMRAFGIAPLRVDCSSHRPTITITALKTIRPKNKLDVHIQVKGCSNSAWLTLAAVDEGICQLTDFQTPDPFDFFYSKKRLDVDSYDIYSFILPEVEETKKSTPSGDYMEKVRKKHITPVSVTRVKPVSLWSGIIKTDDNGLAKVSFDVPEFQGSLRLMAVASSKAYFGSAKTEVIVRDPIVLTPIFPRFLTARDRFTVPVSVFNGCGKAGEFTISLKVYGPVEIIGEATRAVKVSPNKEKIVFFELKVKDAIGKVTFKLFAFGLGEKTEVTTELPIRPFSPVITKSGSFVITSASPQVFELPGDWLAGTEQAKIIISSFPAVKFSGGLQYLLRYPHGCIEQTTSKVFPLIYFDELAKIAEPELFKHNSADYYIEEGIAKLESMQIDSGAFSYWPGSSDINE